jgi:hypothetical protein
MLYEGFQANIIQVISLLVEYNFGVRRLANPRLLNYVIFLVSILFLVWGNYPSQSQKQMLRIPGIGQQTLTWNPRIRAGESGTLRLDFDPAELGLGGFSVRGVEQNTFYSFLQLPLNASNHMLAEVRIEMPGVILDPGGELIQPLVNGKPISLSWKLTPIETGDLEGEIWLYIKNISKDQNRGVRQPISIINIQARSIDLLGMSGQTVRIVGIIGVCIALILMKDSMIKFANQLLSWSKKQS